MPTAIFFVNCFFSTLGKEVPLPTGIACSRQIRICRLPGFADCHAVGKAMALPTARQLAKNCSRQRQAMVDAIHTVTFADCHSVNSRQRRRLCQLPLMAVGKDLIFFLIFDPSFFVLPCYSKYMIYSKFGIILIYFAIFRRFFLFL